jgi:hypothetical protein
MGCPSPVAAIEFRLEQAGRFPIGAMAKVGWIPTVRNLSAHSEELVRDLIKKAGGPTVAGAALY